MLSEVTSALILAPHCDDAELGCGGLMMRLRALGARVYVIVLTVDDQTFLHRGNVPATERVREFEAAGRVLGVTSSIVLTRGWEAKLHLYPRGDLVQLLDRKMNELRPDSVWIPLPSAHQDHEVAFAAGVAACRPSAQKDWLRFVAAYEYPMTFWGPGALVQSGGMYVDITEFLPRKLDALREYSSQMRSGQSLISLKAARTLAEMRGLEAGTQYAELFRVLRWRT